jgi:hypothetical protein
VAIESRTAKLRAPSGRKIADVIDVIAAALDLLRVVAIEFIVVAPDGA